MDENYFLKLIKNISWNFNNIFSPSDSTNIKRNVYIDDKDLDLLVTTGITSDTADERKKGMWMSHGQNKVEHYFENLYKKLACCTGKYGETITVPVLTRLPNGKIGKKYKTITIDRKKECTINGIDWTDDNLTPENHNKNCERFMQRLFAFLSKYDPDNPMIETYGGCLANKNLEKVDKKILTDPFLFQIVNTNRRCLIDSCNKPQAYKRQQDRYNCETTICKADFAISDVQAGGAIDVFGNKIVQQCGANSEIAKKLVGIDDTEEEKEEEVKKPSLDEIVFLEKTKKDEKEEETGFFDYLFGKTEDKIEEDKLEEDITEEDKIQEKIKQKQTKTDTTEIFGIKYWQLILLFFFLISMFLFLIYITRPTKNIRKPIQINQ